MHKTYRNFFILGVPLFIGLGFLVVGWISFSAPFNNWLTGVFTSMGVVFISVTVTEVYLTKFRQWIKKEDERAFEELFGTRASDDPGRIFLQDDRIDKLLQEVFEPDQIKSATDKLNAPFRPQQGHSAPRPNPLFKARRWVNAHDAEGAREIRDAFRKIGFAPPELTIEGCEESYAFKKLPLIICMGLGFATESLDIVDKVCKGWMLIDSITPNGDAVALHENIWRNSPDFERPLENPDRHNRLFPPSWKHEQYLRVPDNLHEGPRIGGGSSPTPNDYAIILRDTEELQTGDQQIRFVLAGFTAHGTAAAGEYLANNWRTLWSRYVKGNAKHGDGDFCEIIVGNSGERPWRRAHNISLLTPKELATDDRDISCKWTTRYLHHHPRPSAFH